MVARIAPEVEHKVLAYLDLGMTPKVILKTLKKQNIVIHPIMISRIRNRRENPIQIKPKVQKRGNRSILSSVQFSQLNKIVQNPNPPTQKEMANKFKVSQQVISYQINKVLKKKLVKKPKGQRLSAATIEKRRRRSWPLYMRLRGDRWKSFITSDEAWFYLVNIDGKTRVQYISRHQNRSVCETFSTETHPKGVMVWIGISANGCTKVRFVKPGAKINSKYYIDNVLKPFIREDIPKLYPNGVFTFHQDSAPSHTAKMTLKFLNENKITFITPSQWLPNSPDVAPLDFFFWGYLKWRVSQRRPKTLNGLKKVIIEEVKKVPQTMINKALKSWGKRCRQIYYNKGLHIEKN